MKQVTVLGSTGSIGRQALEVIADKPEAFSLFGISARSNVSLALEQAHAFHPRIVACETEFDASLLPVGTEAIFGIDAAERLAGMAEADVVVNGISGFSALLPLLSSLSAGKRVALANKESIVCGNALVWDTAKRFGGEILPVDSEQSAIFQCLQNGRRDEVETLILTASGGPFWQKEPAALEHITVEQALHHPTWSMGKKITIDSATLFNKGLEVIEAGYLFDLPARQIEVVIHPQSIIHSMVHFCDGTVMANMSWPDMRLPIQYAMTYPARERSVCRPLYPPDAGTLSFHAADPARFPALAMAFDALASGGSYPIVYNGANESAVQAFCDGRIGFMDISRMVGYTLQKHRPSKPATVEDILAVDRDARALAETYLH